MLAIAVVLVGVPFGSPLREPGSLASTPALQEAAPRTGLQQLVFTSKHPLGSLKEQAKRFGWPLSKLREGDPAKGEYDLSRETFEVWVPSSYDADQPPGLLVWISPMNSGRLMHDWQAVLERHNLIGVGANQAGNERRIHFRVALALDAVVNLQDRFTLDPERIYAAGFSGGGRIASRLGIHYADVFQGGIYMGGCNYFRDIPNPAKEGHGWPAAFPRPSGKRAILAKKTARHVFLIGSEDFNLVQSRAIFKEMGGRDKFAHTTFLEIPRFQHDFPAAEWLEKALVALDAGLQR
jgi:dienelactone hydrolase